MAQALSSPFLANRPRSRLKISLTPLIDVVFILLVFFMLASSFLDWRTVQLSSAGQQGAASGVEGALLVDLTNDGLRLSGERVSAEVLAQRIADRLAEKPEQRVLVRPAQGIDMQRMVGLLDQLAAAGAANIALMPGGR
ncbi:biopolymer transporter ExbD [Rhodobacteraceae bacterium NNCM2]|nr:biopolymer transporter ExbD [Coraliihabitans acroporae]